MVSTHPVETIIQIKNRLNLFLIDFLVISLLYNEDIGIILHPLIEKSV